MRDFFEIKRSGRVVAIVVVKTGQVIPIVSGEVSSPSGGNSRPGVPTWGRAPAEYVFGQMSDPTTGLPTGFMGQDIISQQMFPWADFLGMLGGPLNAAGQAGTAQRDMGAGLTAQAVGNTMGLANQSQQSSAGIMDLLAQIPGFEGAAVQLSQNINRGAGGLQNAIGGATQTMQNVMNPTAYNPLYQNAMTNQVVPTTNAAFSSRGLGSSGAAIDTISRTGQNLSDQFAQRQFQEQMGAQANLGGLSNQLGQLGVAGAQVPGAVLNQLMTAAGAGQQGINTAMQNQLGPLGALTAGSNQVWQGINNPMNAIFNASGFVNQPLGNLQQGILGLTSQINSPTTGWLQKVAGKA